MRLNHPVVLLVLLVLVVASATTPAHAGGIVSVCDEAHLLTALTGGGTVTFSCSGTIILTAEITISADTTIGSSGQAVTISGNHAVRVFTVNGGVTLNLNALTVADGHASGGDGGGIFNTGTVIVSNCTFSSNTSSNGGGGIYSSRGSLAVNNSTFTGNSANGLGGGGGIYNLLGNTVIVSNSTFTGNSAQTGGGISNLGRMTVSNSTFIGNSAANFGGGIYSYNSRIVKTTLENTIVANSPTGGNCSGAITDGGGNLSYPDATCPGINADPKLSPLQDNGGPTRTMALLPGSWAIDAGNDATCSAAPVNNLDQRGVARPYGSHCDSGAYEAPLPPMLPRAYLPLIVR